MKKVLVIVGPTASGKTSLSLDLAQRFHGEIISGDSMQIYKSLNIVSAKASAEDQKRIPHHLIDIKNIDENYSVAEFQQDVRKKIEEISAKNKLPIIVGGTGLYLKAALYDYYFQNNEKVYEIPPLYLNASNDTLHGILSRIDYDSSKVIHKNNRRRVLRAIEIAQNYQKTKSTNLNEQTKKCLYDAKFVGLNMERSKLYERINLRVDQMVEEGLFQELEPFQNCISTASQAIGFKEVRAYFRQELTKEEAIELIKKNTRNYAKRQLTWFHHQLPVQWFEMEKNILLIENFVKEWW